MPMTHHLTDEDRELISQAASHRIGDATPRERQEYIYLAGIERGRRLGLEEAAKAIDGYALQIGDKIYGIRTSKECAAAIRALKD